MATRTYDAGDLATAQRIQCLRSQGGMSVAEIEQILRVDPPPNAPADDDRTIGPKLRRLRLAAGRTWKKLAAELGVGPSLLSSLERTSLGIDIPCCSASRLFTEQ